MVQRNNARRRDRSAKDTVGEGGDDRRVQVIFVAGVSGRYIVQVKVPVCGCIHYRLWGGCSGFVNSAFRKT